MSLKTSRYPRLFERIYNKPLLLEPDKAATIERVFRAHLEQPSEVLRSRAFFDDGGDIPDAPINENPPYEILDGGIAIIQVMGTLVQRSSWLDAMSGLTSYASIGFDFAQAEADPKVAGIMLEIDSGGGEVNGCFDLVDQIANSTKPVWAVANEAAYSAAYAIASAADRLFMPRTAGVGSIGVIALHVDQSKADEKKGLRYTPIFAGDHKFDGNSHEPLPDGVKAAIQADIDRLYQIFVETVAMNRSMTAEAVVATQADVFHPGAAIDLGLADDTGTMVDALTLFQEFLASPTVAASRAAGGLGFPSAATAASSEGVLMDPKDQAVNPANITPEALAAARNEAAADATKTATATASAAERARVASILASDEAKGRGALATHLATETDMSADAAIKLLAKSPKEAPIAAATNAFAAAMDASGNPAVRADVDADADKTNPESEAAAAAAIASFQRKPAAAK